MKKAASVSSRAKALARKTAQEIILYHLQSVSGHIGWLPEPAYMKDGKFIPVLKVPSTETYLWLQKKLEDSPELVLNRVGVFELLSTTEGLLIINREGITSKRFKARRDFGSYLQKLKALYAIKSEHTSVKHDEQELSSYERIRARQERRKVYRFDDGNTKVTLVADEPKKRMKRGSESKLAKKYGFSSYEDYKKFQQRARRDLLI